MGICWLKIAVIVGDFLLDHIYVLFASYYEIGISTASHKIIKLLLFKDN